MDDDIPRQVFDRFVRGGRTPHAVLLSFPDQDDPDVTVRGVTTLHRSGDEAHVTSDVYVLEGDTYVWAGGGGGSVLDLADFEASLVHESAPRPLDEDETRWLVPRIETGFGPARAVTSRVTVRPATDSDWEPPR